MIQRRNLETTLGRDNPGVIAKAPLIYWVAVGLGFALRFLRPMPIGPGAIHRWAGSGLVVVGFLLVFFAIRQFRRRGTFADPKFATTTIVTSGLFRFSRNPMYVGLTMMLAGIGLAANDWWFLLMLVPVMVVMHVGVIFREERYLERKFGRAYLDYKATVRRWF